MNEQRKDCTEPGSSRAGFKRAGTQALPPDGMLRCPGAEKGTLGAVPLAFFFFFFF